MLAGPIANFILAIAAFILLFSLYGVSTAKTELSTIVENSPAAEAGLKAGDIILAIDGKKVKKFSDIQKIVQISPDETLKFLQSRR